MYSMMKLSQSSESLPFANMTNINFLVRHGISTRIERNI